MGYDKPAFPVPSPVSEYTDGSRMDGMSLRDFFAAAALTGILAGAHRVQYKGGGSGPDANADAASSDAYGYADAMLRERNRGADPDTDAK